MIDLGQGLGGKTAQLIHALRVDGELDGVHGHRNREADPVDFSPRALPWWNASDSPMAIQRRISKAAARQRRCSKEPRITTMGSST
eukprot:895022-Heterocapsa_arctica.AAC.1